MCAILLPDLCNILLLYAHKGTIVFLATKMCNFHLSVVWVISLESNGLKRFCEICLPCNQNVCRNYLPCNQNVQYPLMFLMLSFPCHSNVDKTFPFCKNKICCYHDIALINLVLLNSLVIIYCYIIIISSVTLYNYIIWCAFV